MSRIAKLTLAILCPLAIVQLGCIGLAPGGASTIVPSFADISQSALDLLPTNTVILQLVNNVTAADGTPYTVELDITIDGTPQTLTAAPGVVTKYALGYCPSEVRTVVERWIDAKSRVVGGRNYAGVDVNSFPAGSFGCSSTLLWQLSATEVRTQAL